jgi:hypothetical protein
LNLPPMAAVRRTPHDEACRLAMNMLGTNSTSAAWEAARPTRV